MDNEPGDVTQLLQRSRTGDTNAREELARIIYPHLRRIATVQMRKERNGHTLQPTALAHEAYMRLMGQSASKDWQGRAHFFAVAAQMMRQILVDYARQHGAAKRGGALARVELRDDLAVTKDGWSTILALDAALTRLAQMDARQARVVELRFFGGLSEEETADVLAISSRTVKRDWSLAKAWLYEQLGD
jgi:RNA polymerase sigma-70 factor, ECF subfamily